MQWAIQSQCLAEPFPCVDASLVTNSWPSFLALAETALSYLEDIRVDIAMSLRSLQLQPDVHLLARGKNPRGRSLATSGRHALCNITEASPHSRCMF